MPCAEGKKKWIYGRNCNGNEEPCMLCGQVVCLYHAASNSDGVKGGHSDCSGGCNISAVFLHMCRGHMKRCGGCEKTYCSYHRQQAGRGKFKGGHECEVHCKTSHIWRQNCSGEVIKCVQCPYAYCEYHLPPVSKESELRGGHVCKGVTDPSKLSSVGSFFSGVVGFALGDSPVISEDRATSLFPGRVELGGANICIVSFPGKFVQDWDKLVRGRVSSACVFLPKDDPKQRFGEHAKNPETGSCWCHDLYGEPKEWGCLWFEHWQRNVSDAVRLGLKLIVVFFQAEAGKGVVEWSELRGSQLWDGVGLGGSQKGEVAWIRKQGIAYEAMDIDDIQPLLS
mmetsp:Transcript_137866/g.384417  ORF Transcript_137866/g.384417 Transcript_137866/m.384417 type:complete len:339 (-) Transcript_137866:92-1108(-)